jgi:hypothetical protein
VLVLKAVDIAGPSRWRWLLTAAESGLPLADHQVDLDPDSRELATFCDLYEYVRSYAAPDKRAVDEPRIVAETGAWAGRVLLGEPVGGAIVEAARAGSVTVRVVVPAELDRVLMWPLELAHVEGRPLASRGDVTLVYDIATEPVAKDVVLGALRMLAVFSQPTRTSVLALRRERYELGRFIRRIAARQRAKVDLRIVQYGVTRERLKEIAEDGDGWDVLHLSGHGGRGLFLLEHPDGTPDPVDTAELVALLRPARRRVQLAVLSACQSAADTTAQALRLIGLADQADAVEAESGGQPAGEATGLARSLVRELGCAVVAMRYPVTDEFAIAFGDVLYEQLLSRQQPVDTAVARALAEATRLGPSAARPAVSIATPGVFGARAAGLTLTPPRGTPLLDPAERAMAYFPSEPQRFVGRAAAMAAASTALAAGSGRTALLLHGMAGAGKTACALELAYRHYDGFAAAAFWQAPTDPDQWAGALPSLAVALEAQLGGYGFTMTGHIGTAEALTAFLPRLRKVLDDSGVLLLLDNLETLLTPGGGWRDPRWGALVDALTGHGGESRLILTSRIVPVSLGARVLARPVHALSLEEAVALARELPNLRDLLHADGGPVRAGVAADVDADRDRVRRVLRVVQGHPKLLELADAAAADRDRLDAQLTAAEQASAGEQLEAFFRDGASTLDPERFLDALGTWTSTALSVLPEEARLMAEFVACLEDDDRQSAVVEANWGDVWRRLGRAGDPPEPGPLLDVLAAAALIQPESSSVGQGQPADGAVQEPVRYRMHPGAAAAVQVAAGSEVGAAADTELGAFWESVSYQAWQREDGEDTATVVYAGLAAAPYLLRLGEWDAASTVLEDAVVRDGSPGVVQAVLPSLRRIAAATQAPKDHGVLARVLKMVDPTGAERLLRDTIRAAAGSGDYRVAHAAAGDLASLLRDVGLLGEALEVAGQASWYTGQAGLGPWTQLADEAGRLQILSQMGKHEQVLAQTDALRAQMDELPARSVGNETVNPWDVREALLDTSHASALALGRWQQCLDLNAEVIASKERRGAGDHEITGTRVNDAAPLIRLGRLVEAGRLLRECQQIFEDHADATRLARVLGTRADLEDERGHPAAAAEFGRTALRLGYAHPDPRDLAVGHHNLAYYLRESGGDPAGQRAHRLAAALIYRLTGMTHDLARARRALAAELGQGDAAGAGGLPGTLAEVVRVAELTDGVRLGALITVLHPDRAVAEAALAQILREAADPPPDDGIARNLAAWEPVISAVAAACRGHQDAAAELGPFLDEQAKEPDWAALAAVLRRILDGERGDTLLDGLDPIGTAIARETLTRLAVGEQSA